MHNILGYQTHDGQIFLEKNIIVEICDPNVGRFISYLIGLLYREVLFLCKFKNSISTGEVISDLLLMIRDPYQMKIISISPKDHCSNDKK